MKKSTANEKHQILFPKNLTRAEVPDLYHEVRKSSRRVSPVLDLRNVKEFDSGGTAFLRYLKKSASGVQLKNIPPALEEALGSPEQKPREKPEISVKDGIFTRLAEKFLAFSRRTGRFFSLLADEIYHTFGYIRSRRGVYPGAVIQQLNFMGYQSIPILCLITFLVGLTISLTSAAQLKLFGADIYLAYFVGYAMILELVPLMTGIILAGKIGAAITAEISTMSVMEEIDALKTMGIAPVKFLMVPRLIAITLAVPALVCLGDIVGILGGILVSIFFQGIPASVFIEGMLYMVNFGDFLTGLLKTLAFGWAIVIGSGYKGMFVRRGAEEVGRATTQSVVLSVTLIIIIDCIFAFFLYQNP
ncbi:MAG: ABC transporter permease [Candidatus Aminicenantes bacterium]